MHRHCPGPHQCLGTTRDRCTRGNDIVNHEQAFAAHGMRLTALECTLDGEPPVWTASPHLGSPILNSFEGMQDRNLGHRRDADGKQLGLVKAALAQTSLVYRNRHETVDIPELTGHPGH